MKLVENGISLKQSLKYIDVVLRYFLHRGVCGANGFQFSSFKFTSECIAPL